jgi:hypothetical protein
MDMKGRMFRMKGKGGITAIAVAGGLTIAVLAWMYTAPYPGNTGLSRTPGIIIGGTLTPPVDDWTTVREGRTVIMKLAGFPPFVVYLNYAVTPEGIITATRPDGGYWGRRVREGRGDGWLRIGDRTYAMTATEVLGDARLPMLQLWAGSPNADISQPLGGVGEPLNTWEVFFWTPR